MKFGKRIRAVRKNAGYSQKEFGSLLGIPQATLSAYETDRMQPTVSSLIRIAKKFNVSLDWLCGIKNPKKPDNTSAELNAVLTEAEEFLNEFLRKLSEVRESDDK